MMREGDELIWLYSPRGGWGYTIPVPCVVRSLPSAKYARIEVKNLAGDAVLRTVKRGNLKGKRNA